MNKDNQKYYQKTFSHLRLPDPVHMEDIEMNKNTKRNTNWLYRPATAILSLVLIGGTAAYASDLGRIRTTISTWFHGEPVEVEAVDSGEGSYEFYNARTGESIGAGGGVAFDENGREIRLPAEDVLKNLTGDFVSATRDGQTRLLLLANEQAYDLSELVNAQGVVRGKLKVTTSENSLPGDPKAGDTLYFEVKWNPETGAFTSISGTDLSRMDEVSTDPAAYTDISGTAVPASEYDF